MLTTANHCMQLKSTRTITRHPKTSANQSPYCHHQLVGSFQASSILFRLGMVINQYNASSVRLNLAIGTELCKNRLKWKICFGFQIKQLTFTLCLIQSLYHIFLRSCGAHVRGCRLIWLIYCQDQLKLQLQPSWALLSISTSHGLCNLPT